MDDFQIQQQKKEQERQNKQKEVLHCKKCTSVLSKDDVFCPECGEKIGGQENKCIWCGFLTTKTVCPDCGKRIFPQTCSKCGKETYFDICEQCGQVLNQNLILTQAEEKVEVKEMSNERAEEILKEFEALENPELEYFRKQIKEHEILLAEKQFFDEREKRINETFGENQTAIKYPDPEETQFLQEASKGIRQAALQKEQEQIQEELEKKFPGVKSLEEEHEDLLALIKQREELLQNALDETSSKLDSEIKAAEEKRQRKLEELKRRIEEQRKREEEIAREKRRLELEAFRNRVNGSYVDSSYGEELRIILDVGVNGNLTIKTIEKYDKNYHRQKFASAICVTTGTGYLNGNTVTFTSEEYFFPNNPHNLKKDDFLHNFRGTINSSGTVLSGYWFSDSHANSYFDYRKY